MTDLTDRHRNAAQTLHSQRRTKDRPDSHRTADNQAIVTDRSRRSDTALLRLWPRVSW
jgi:hypothetical protein